MTSARPAWVFLFALFSLLSCAAPQYAPPEDAADINRLMAMIAAKNEALKTFKGIGTAVINDGARNRIARVAWIGSTPGKLRFEILNPMGRPAASIAMDGEYMYYLTRDGRRQFHKTRSSNPSLRRVANIAVRTNEVMAFLTGRVPVADHRRALLEKGADGETVLILKRWGSAVQKIFIDEAASEIRAVEAYGYNGSRIYRADFSQYKTIEGYDIPFHLAVTDDEGRRFTLDVQRYWVDVDVDEGKFVLHPLEDF